MQAYLDQPIHGKGRFFKKGFYRYWIIFILYLKPKGHFFISFFSMSGSSVRIILTGHAELDMALQAINEGAIYRFLRKPWDNNELALAVRLGIRQYEIEAENRHLLALVEKHRDFLTELEEKNPGVTGLKKTSDGKIVIDEDDIQQALAEFGDSVLIDDDIRSGK